MEFVSHRITKVLLVFSFIAYTMCAWASQGGYFEFSNNKKRQVVRFELINNLIVLPVEVNGQKLRFLLDSGVNTTIIFNNNQIINPHLENAQKILLQGLGEGDPVTAHITIENTLKIKHLVAKQQTIFLIDETEFEFARRMGTQIDGIIGSSLFSSCLITVKYDSQQLKFLNFENKRKNFCSRCYELPLEIEENKPYIHIKGKLSPDQPIKGKFLVDSGSGDSVWLFPELGNISIVKPTFEDFLGRAINGNIYGQRGKIASISLGDKTFNGVKVAYPNLQSLEHLSRSDGRIGSIGGEILKRFRVTYDYRSKRLYLRSLKRKIQPFYYNMSGLEIQHNGVELTRKQITNNLGVKRSEENQVSGIEVFLQPQFKLELVPVIEIFEVRPHSPAEKAGVQPGDILKRINGSSVSKMKISEIIHRLQKKPGQKLRIVVERKSRMLKFNFTLQPLFG
ncbi:MAG: aspartyl protease family protein [Flavobacteriaceae bacterium]|nr:aspartyl protease family protein [Flavobacteriaceae bacterium]